MSITSVKSGATGISLALDNNFMEPIATTLVGSGGSSNITFNDIPQTYKHLQIRMLARITTATFRQSVKLTFNSDFGTNYSRHTLYGDGSSAGSFGVASSAFILVTDFAAASATSSIFGAAVVDILDYTNTNKYKTTRSIGGVDLNAAQAVEMGLSSGAWLNTTAITSITLVPFADNFVQYSRFSLYGVKG